MEEWDLVLEGLYLCSGGQVEGNEEEAQVVGIHGEAELGDGEEQVMSSAQEKSLFKWALSGKKLELRLQRTQWRAESIYYFRHRVDRVGSWLLLNHDGNSSAAGTCPYAVPTFLPCRVKGCHRLMKG